MNLFLILFASLSLSMKLFILYEPSDTLKPIFSFPPNFTKFDYLPLTEAFWKPFKAFPALINLALNLGCHLVISD